MSLIEFGVNDPSLNFRQTTLHLSHIDDGMSEYILKMFLSDVCVRFGRALEPPAEYYDGNFTPNDVFTCERQPGISLCPCILSGDGKDSSHANLLIFDSNKNIAYRFEPHGSEKGYERLDDVLRKAAKQAGWTYQSPADVNLRTVQGKHSHDLEVVDTSIRELLRLIDADLSNVESIGPAFQKKFEAGELDLDAMRKLVLTAASRADKAFEKYEKYDDLGFCASYCIMCAIILFENPGDSILDVFEHIASIPQSRANIIVRGYAAYSKKYRLMELRFGAELRGKLKVEDIPPELVADLFIRVWEESGNTFLEIGAGSACGCGA